MPNEVTSASATDSADRAQVRAHIEKHLGPIKRTFTMQPPDAIDIVVAQVPPQETRPVHTLVTLGMSDRPMTVPAGNKAPRYIELMMTLPRTWRFDDKSLADGRWYWPIEQLLRVARKPRVEGSWLGWGEVIPNGDPPQRYAATTKLCGAVVVPSLLVPQDFYELTIAAHKIAFFALLPLYQEEMRLQRDKGSNHLFETLLDRDVKDYIDPTRTNVAKKRFGLF